MEMEREIAWGADIRRQFLLETVTTKGVQEFLDLFNCEHLRQIAPSQEGFDLA